jgi:type IV pilus biogenesis/stability protein PilW
MATSADAFQLALHHHRAGNLSEAERLYRMVLQHDPHHLDALRLLGVLARQVGRSDLAIEYLGQVLRLHPNFPEAHNDLGVTLREQGRLDEAVAAFDEAVRLKPDFADVYNNLGVTRRLQGKPAEAAASYRQALRLHPDWADVHSNLGNVLKDQGQLDAAITCYQQALRLQPHHAHALNNLGTALHEQGQLGQAVAYFQQAVRLQPDYAAAHSNLGCALDKLGRLDEAVASFQQALRLQPEYPDAYRNLALTYHRQGKLIEAADCLREVLRRRPDDPVAQHLLAAVTSGATPKQPPAGYVSGLFDGYADQYDQHLVGQLGYCGPQLLREALGTAAAPDLDILDLGCGTGLCGLRFQDLARSLTGVDLSPKMLAKAQTRGIYQDLICGDLLVPLQRAPAAFDLILAADVFTYLGDLAEAFRAARSALRPGGYFVFLVENNEGDEYVLRASGRFAHSLPYLRRLTAQVGLVERTMTQEIVRRDREQPVPALVLVLQCSSDQ